jgi:hypothetical protein
MEEYLPMFSSTQAQLDAAGAADYSTMKWAGRRPDFARALEAMGRMCADTHAPVVIKDCVVWILDGTGTPIFRPTDPEHRAKMFCYWKKENQIRWYIAVDARGYIDFVSPVYHGKLDDSTALRLTGFYE